MGSIFGAGIGLLVMLMIVAQISRMHVEEFQRQLVRQEAALLQNVSDAAVAWVARHRHRIVSCVRDRPDDTAGRTWVTAGNHGTHRNAMFAEVEVPFFEHFRGRYRRPSNCTEFPTLEAENTLPAGVRPSNLGGVPAGPRGLRFAASVVVTNDGARRLLREDAGTVRFEAGAAALQLWVIGFPAWTGTLNARDSLAADGGYEMARVLDRVDSPYWGASICDGTNVRLGSFDPRTVSPDFDADGFGNDWNPPGASGAFGGSWNTQIVVCPSGVAFQQPPVPSLGDRVPALAYRVTMLSSGRAGPGQSAITTNLNQGLGFERVLFGIEAMRVGTGFTGVRHTTLPRGLYVARVDDGQLAQSASGGAPVVDCGEGLLWTAASRAACSGSARNEGEWNRVRGNFYVDGKLYVGLGAALPSLDSAASGRTYLPDSPDSSSTRDTSGGYALRLGRSQSNPDRGVIRGRFSSVSRPADLVFGGGSVRATSAMYVDGVLSVGRDTGVDPQSLASLTYLPVSPAQSAAAHRGYALRIGRLMGSSSDSVIRGPFASSQVKELVFSSTDGAALRLYSSIPGAFIDGFGAHSSVSVFPTRTVMVGPHLNRPYSVGLVTGSMLGYSGWGNFNGTFFQRWQRQSAGSYLNLSAGMQYPSSTRSHFFFNRPARFFFSAYVDGMLSVGRDPGSSVNPTGTLSPVGFTEGDMHDTSLVSRGYALRLGRSLTDARKGLIRGRPVSNVGAEIVVDPSRVISSVYQAIRDPATPGVVSSWFLGGQSQVGSSGAYLNAYGHPSNADRSNYWARNVGFSVSTTSGSGSSGYLNIGVTHPVSGAREHLEDFRAHGIRRYLGSSAGTSKYHVYTPMLFNRDSEFAGDVDFASTSDVDFKGPTGRLDIRRRTIFTRLGGPVQVRGGMRFDGRSASDSSVLDMTDEFAGVRATARVSPSPTPPHHTDRLYYDGDGPDAKKLQLGHGAGWTQRWGVVPPSTPLPTPSPGINPSCPTGHVSANVCSAAGGQWEPLRFDPENRHLGICTCD